MSAGARLVLGIEQHRAGQRGLEHAVAELAGQPDREQPPEPGLAQARRAGADRAGTPAGVLVAVAPAGHGDATLAVADVTGQDVGVPADAARPSSRWVGARARRPGCLLVAAPALTEATFAHTVLYVLEHDESGTAAVILNRPSRTPVGQVLPDWHDVVSGPSVVFSGGPVQPDGALCLGLLSEVGAPAAGRRRCDSRRRSVDRRQARRPSGRRRDLHGRPRRRGRPGRPRRRRACGSSPGTPAGRPASSTTNSPPGRGSCCRADARMCSPTTPERLRRDVLRRQPSPLNLLSTYPRDPSLELDRHWRTSARQTTTRHIPRGRGALSLRNSMRGTLLPNHRVKSTIARLRRR